MKSVNLLAAAFVGEDLKKLASIQHKPEPTDPGVGRAMLGGGMLFGGTVGGVTGGGLAGGAVVSGLLGLLRKIVERRSGGRVVGLSPLGEATDTLGVLAGGIAGGVAGRHLGMAGANQVMWNGKPPKTASMKNTDILRLALVAHTKPTVKQASAKVVPTSGQAMVVALCVEEHRKEAGSIFSAIRGAFGGLGKARGAIGGASKAVKALPAPGTGAGRVVGLSPLGKRVATGVGGLALGGAGYMGGNAQGRQQGATQAMEGVVQQMENMPWQQRLGYLFAPQAATNRMVEQVNGVLPGFAERIQSLRMQRPAA